MGAEALPYALLQDQEKLETLFEEDSAIYIVMIYCWLKNSVKYVIFSPVSYFRLYAIKTHKRLNANLILVTPSMKS